MHNRKPEGIESREIGLRDALVVAPLVACIVALALYPGLILGRSDAAVKDKIAATCVDGTYPTRSEAQRPAVAGRALQRAGPADRSGWTGYGRCAMTFHAPHIDYAGLSPVIALTAGICAVLVGGRLQRRRQRLVVSALSLTALATAAGLCIWQWGDPRGPRVGSAAPGRAGARRRADRDLRRGLRDPADLAGARGRATRREPRHGEFQALLLELGRSAWSLLAQAQNLIIALRLPGAALGPALRPVRLGGAPARARSSRGSST